MNIRPTNWYFLFKIKTRMTNFENKKKNPLLWAKNIVGTIIVR